MKTEVRIAGIGGQGVVLSGVILGRAASLFDGRHAIQTQAYGSDIRGGDVCCEVIISDEPIVYPAVKKPDVLVALAQRAYDANHIDLKPKGILIIDGDLVQPVDLRAEITLFAAAFNRTATEEMGKRIVSNMIMLGYLMEKTGLITSNALSRSITDLVPADSLQLNLRAVSAGAALAESVQ